MQCRLVLARHTLRAWKELFIFRLKAMLNSILPLCITQRCFANIKNKHIVYLLIHPPTLASIWGDFLSHVTAHRQSDTRCVEVNWLKLHLICQSDMNSNEHRLSPINFLVLTDSQTLKLMWDSHFQSSQAVFETYRKTSSKGNQLIGQYVSVHATSRWRLKGCGPWPLSNSFTLKTTPEST